MQTTFYKYQGTGNDFVMIDNRDLSFPKSDVKLIEKLCDRRFGIGADGLILLEDDEQTDFRMVYYNSDGNQSSMCGNGGRCLVAFAKSFNIITNSATFIAIDGIHHATIDKENVVTLQMKDVQNIETTAEYVFLDTGSPHHVQMEEDIEAIDIKSRGAQIRYSDLYGKAGSNVNFVKQENDHTFTVRTYERGVEDETLSCGTGVTAVAIAMRVIKKTNANAIILNVRGGRLEVSFKENLGNFTDIFLKGEAIFVYKGQIEW